MGYSFSEDVVYVNPSGVAKVWHFCVSHSKGGVVYVSPREGEMAFSSVSPSEEVTFVFQSERRRRGFCLSIPVKQVWT